MEESDAHLALTIQRYENIAVTLERGLFDGIFFVDVLALFDTYAGSFVENLKGAGQMFFFEPLQILAAIGRSTSHLGLCATMSTSFYHPFHIARSFSTLDHLTGGRAGWNIVTSAIVQEAQNFGRGELEDAKTRYDRADETVAACMRLWDSWGVDAIRADKQGGVYADPTRVQYANFKGDFVSCRGPLTTPRSPQVSPVLMQAGSSDRGRQFAARWAEVVFTMQNDKARMVAFHDDVKNRVANVGRRPDSCKVLPAIDVIVAGSEDQAKERAEYVNSFASSSLGIVEMSNMLGVDLSSLRADDAVSSLTAGKSSKGMRDLIVAGFASGDGTLSDAGRAYAISQFSPQIVGTPSSIADYMEDLFRSKACDGFIICPSVTPSGYIQFVDMVVPELQRRGLFRRAYAGPLFRDNLGI